ncbi:diaminopimelate decarboxylase [Silanimonas sp.]|uniref:diaminopimelate decarboxylase n=1 Tax=Silanimonas sp. TaxID=1929290 RepID=UPI0022C15550|nr:diaminopimelate decarboxylase [Silanimonas sp.]MCZ8165722.1 diaminopimelate decarboxylase [Silanimonas sp.]
MDARMDDARRMDAQAWQGVDWVGLAHALPTPFYAYSAPALRARVARLQAAFSPRPTLIAYAVKANGNLGLLRLLAEAGLGADIVSAGELARARAAGIPGERIVFSGVGKTAEEMRQGLEAGVRRFNVESREELEVLDGVARAMGRIADVALRINPDIDAGTHGKISTGRAGNKFGIDLPEARRLFSERATWRALRIDGLHMHIGSQITDEVPLRRAAHSMVDFAREIRALGASVRSLDFGGGLGVPYREGQATVPVEHHAALIRGALAAFDPHFDGDCIIEPGRWLVAEAGVLVTRVLRVKRGADREFLILDAAMNDLMRPALYDAWHDIVPLVSGRPMASYDVVGPVCETGDTFATARDLPACRAGDLVAILGAGAYGASMASTYNSRPLVAEVLVDGPHHALLRRAQSIEALLAQDEGETVWAVSPRATVRRA